MTPSASGSRFLTSTVLFPGPRSQRLAALVERVSRALGWGVGFSWFRVDSSAVDHPKALALAATLEDKNAVAYVFRLWSWAHRFAPSGRIKGGIWKELEAAIGWPKRDGVLICALLSSGFLDDLNNEEKELSVHDWHEYQGALVEKSKRDADLKKKKRRQNGAKTARAAKSNGAPTGQDRDSTVTDITQPLKDAWNLNRPAECPEWLRTSEKRRAAAMVRLSDEPDTKVWAEAAARLKRSDFCRGLKQGSQWIANPDWFLRPDTLNKILEGQYDTPHKQSVIGDGLPVDF